MHIFVDNNGNDIDNKKYSENADTSTAVTMTLECEICLNVYSHLMMTLRLTKVML